MQVRVGRCVCIGSTVPKESVVGGVGHVSTIGYLVEPWKLDWLSPSTIHTKWDYVKDEYGLANMVMILLVVNRKMYKQVFLTCSSRFDTGNFFVDFWMWLEEIVLKIRWNITSIFWIGASKEVKWPPPHPFLAAHPLHFIGISSFCTYSQNHTPKGRMQ